MAIVFVYSISIKGVSIYEESIFFVKKTGWMFQKHANFAP